MTRAERSISFRTHEPDQATRGAKLEGVIEGFVALFSRRTTND